MKGEMMRAKGERGALCKCGHGALEHRPDAWCVGGGGYNYCACRAFTPDRSAYVREFTQEEREHIEEMMWSTFDGMAFDLLPERGTMRRSQVIEVTLDASYIELNNPSAEDRALMARFRKLSINQQDAAARRVFRDARYGR